MTPIERARTWAKRRDTPLSRVAWRAAAFVREARMPCWRTGHGALLAIRGSVAAVFEHGLRAAWWTPLFLSGVETPAPGLRLEGGIPQVLGPLRIRIGRGVRMSGAVTLCGRASSSATPVLEIGDNCDIGWQTGISVGTLVSIGNNVRIAGRAHLAGFPGHPLDPVRRARGEACDDAQSGDIVIEDDVWLAGGVTVLAGVRIGRGAVIGAGSVVTRDIPPMVLAAGVPCRPIRTIEPGDSA